MDSKSKSSVNNRIEHSQSSSDLINKKVNQQNDLSNSSTNYVQNSTNNCYQSNQSVRKCKSVIQLAMNDKTQSLLYGNFAENKKLNRHSIQIPTAASTITLTIPTPTTVYIAIKQDNFLLSYLQRVFSQSKVNFVN